MQPPIIAARAAKPENHFDASKGVFAEWRSDSRAPKPGGRGWFGAQIAATPDGTGAGVLILNEGQQADVIKRIDANTIELAIEGDKLLRLERR